MMILKATYFNRIFSILTILLLSSCGNDYLSWNLNNPFSPPIVSSGTVSQITYNTATISGTVVDEGGSAVTVSGICYSTTQDPLISSNVVNAGSGLGAFNAQLTGLNQGTVYYARAFATSSVTTSYGSQLTFTTQSQSPVVSTGTASQITHNTATVAGNVTSQGSSNVSSRGICYSTTQDPLISSNVVNAGSGLGAFNAQLTGLNQGTVYYARAFATNSATTSYGSQLTFTTQSPLPVVSTGTVSQITHNTATVAGNVTSQGSSNVSSRGICYDVVPNTNIVSSNVSSFGTGTGAYSVNLNSLTGSSTYYANTYATNSFGTSYGQEVSFTTNQTPVTLQSTLNCSSLSGVSSVYYGMNGTSAPWGISSSGYSGSCWAAPDPNNSGQLGTVIGANHYVQFNHTFTSTGHIEFWVKTANPGYNNLIPAIVINGVAMGNTTMIGGNLSSFYWMKVQSPAISAGNNTIKILISGSYYDLYIDEIEIWY